MVPPLGEFEHSLDPASLHSAERLDWAVLGDLDDIT